MLPTLSISILQPAFKKALKLAKENGTDEDIASIQAAFDWFDNQGIYPDEIFADAEKYAEAKVSIGRNARCMHSILEECRIYGCD